MATANLTKSANVIAAREVDFVTRFGRNWQDLRDLMSISRLVQKTPGTVLKTKYAEVTLQPGAIGEGEVIPYSQAEVKEKAYAPIVLNKYKKAVSAEAIADHGYQAAVQMTDDQFLVELQNNVLTEFTTFIQTGSLIRAAATFQAALAKAQGEVRNKWKKMKRGITEIVGHTSRISSDIPVCSCPLMFRPARSSPFRLKTSFCTTSILRMGISRMQASSSQLPVILLSSDSTLKAITPHSFPSPRP